MGFVKPVGVVALLTMLERLSSRKDLRLLLPLSGEVCEYLHSSGAFDVMRCFADFSGALPSAMTSALLPVRGLVPCTRFRNQNDVERIANDLEELFQGPMSGYGGLLQVFHTVVSELATNVIYHARSDYGYVLGQEYLYGGNRVVEIAVADAGIGVQASLQKNQRHLGSAVSDTEALALAVEEGSSSLQEYGRGYGLYHVACEIRGGAEREMSMRSGTGGLEIRNDRPIARRDALPDYSGTIVNVVIPC